MYAVAFSEARNVVGVPARISPHSSTVTVEPDGVNLRSPMGDTVWRVASTVIAGVCVLVVPDDDPVELGVVEPEVPDDEPVLPGVVDFVKIEGVL